MGTCGGNLAYDNHLSVVKYKGEVLRKAMSDVTVGRAMVFKVEDAAHIQGKRVSPVGVVKENDKSRDPRCR